MTSRKIPFSIDLVPCSLIRLLLEDNKIPAFILHAIKFSRFDFID
jgi:hypothetical protein